MKSYRRMSFVLVLIMFVVGCSSDDYPKDFNFIFKYGIFERNELDTINNTFKKDLVMAGDITTEIVLTQEEKKEIYNMMKDIDLFNYPDTIEGRRFTPEPGYRLEIYMNRKQKNIHWIGAFYDKKPDDDFRNLVNFIIEIIESKEEYKALPETQGGYE